MFHSTADSVVINYTAIMCFLAVASTMVILQSAEARSRLHSGKNFLITLKLATA